jgi:cytochrome c oxidase cbb3-type subunit IV
MRLARNVLEGVAGLEIFPIIGIILFLLFFIAVVVYVVRMKPSDVDAHSRLPLDNDQDNSTSKTGKD